MCSGDVRVVCVGRRCTCGVYLGDVRVLCVWRGV